MRRRIHHYLVRSASCLQFAPNIYIYIYIYKYK
jgi:hypothetical protein